jgi:hypothetical protein
MVPSFSRGEGRKQPTRTLPVQGRESGVDAGRALTLFKAKAVQKKPLKGEREEKREPERKRREGKKNFCIAHLGRCKGRESSLTGRQKNTFFIRGVPPIGEKGIEEGGAKQKQGGGLDVDVLPVPPTP